MEPLKFTILNKKQQTNILISFTYYICWNHPSVLGVTRPVAAVMAAAVVDVTRASVTAVVIVAIVVASVT